MGCAEIVVGTVVSLIAICATVLILYGVRKHYELQHAVLKQTQEPGWKVEEEKKTP